MRRLAIVIGGLSAALFACTAILGVKDVYLDTSPEAGGDDASAADAGRDGPSATDGPALLDGGDAGDAACGDTQTDPNHCGRCDHSCLGGQCAGGKCQPIELARGPAGATGIALDDRNVYWSSYDGNAILKVPKTGGNPTTLAQAANGVQSPLGVFVEGGYVYWVNTVLFYGSIMRCPVLGCGASPETVVYNLDEPVDLTVDATRVYIALANGFQIASAPKVFPDGGADGGTRLYATASKPRQLVLDGDHIVWIDDGSGEVQRIAIDGGDYRSLGANGLDGRGVTVDSTTAYWVSLAGNVSRRSKDGGGSVTALAVGEGNPLDIVVDQTSAYWIKVVFPSDGGLDLAGSVRTCSLGACAPSDLATGLKHPRALAIDDEAVYWVNHADGAVMKVAK
jgi:hypothetical protein